MELAEPDDLVNVICKVNLIRKHIQMQMSYWYGSYRRELLLAIPYTANLENVCAAYRNVLI